MANDDINDDLARDLLNLWREFTASPEVTGTMDWVQVQDMACRSWLRDGEVFAQVVEGFGSSFKFKGRIPLALELLEADHVPLDYSPNENIESGIERNEWNQPTAFYLFNRHPGSGRATLSDGALKRVPAERILHVAIRERLSGLRGVSQFASILTRLHDLKDYEDSERLAARISAAIAAYVKRDKDMDWSPPEGYDPAVARNFNLRAGAIFDQTLPGESLEMLNPNRPNTALNAFADGQLRRASRGAGLTNSAMSGNYNGSYSAQRQELVEGYDGYRAMTAVFVSRFVRPVWERYVVLAVNAGLVKVPPGVRMETLTQAEFRGPKMPWIDPAKEALGLLMLARGGWQSVQQGIADRGGRLQDTFEQIARERKLAGELGLVFDSDALYTSRSGVTQARPGESLYPGTDDTDDGTAVDAAVDAAVAHALNQVTR